MGQNLTHGVYLPDEGERNCYAGLAANWQILDTSVGTIAEHTTQIAGKAPAVHTHTKSDITDFPAYGTTAGTICEGNDSRLSDARTPVAHTHSKADITDLFNSANTWSGEQTFSVPCKTLGKKLLTGITDLDDAYYNGEVCGFNPNTLHNPTGSYGNVLTINNAVNSPDNIYNSWITQIATTSIGTYLGTRNRSNGGAWSSWIRVLTEAYAIPTVNNTYDLGSSSYQWNNIYSKNYFYNGTAWGLDKANVWTGENTFQAQSIYQVYSDPRYVYKSSILEIGVQPASSHAATSYWFDKNNNELGFTRFVEYDNSVQTYEIRLSNKATNGALNPTGNAISTNIQFTLDPNGVSKLNLNVNTLRPVSDAVSDLGDSTHRWKTLNGINPGALSLPTTDSTKWIDLLGNLTAASSANTYTPAVDGWISVMLKRTGDATAVFLIQGNIKASCFSSTALVGERAFAASACIPVRAGIGVDIHLKGSGATIDSAYFMPCQGNV